MADRQWFIEGVQVHEEGEEEFFIQGVQLVENQAEAPPAGLSIPVAMHHYTKNIQAA